eukprot:s3673_g5.t1
MPIDVSPVNGPKTGHLGDEVKFDSSMLLRGRRWPDEIQRLMMQQAHVWQKLKVTRGLPRETAFRHELHSIKASLRRYKQASRGRWVLDVVHTLELAMAIHDPKQLYNTSATLGIHAEGRSRALEHFDAVMNTPLEVTEETLQTLPRRVATAEHLAQIPGRADIDDAIAYLRESAPGADHATDGLTGSAWGDWANYTASPLRAR